jgi:hypothetical protein
MALLDGWRYAATLKWKARTGYDDYGKGSYGTAVDFLGTVTYKRQLIKNAKGQEVQVDLMLQVPADYAIAPADQVSTDGGTSYKDVVAVASPRDATGSVQHYEVYA